MPESKQSPKSAVIPTEAEKTNSSRRASSHRQSAFGHALDGSQQLDILEEQVYANTDAPGKDRPMVSTEVRDSDKK
ncbi:hypothetical protein ACXX82_16770 [Glaciimonas sp. GNP009]